MNTPVEALEHGYPVRVTRYSLRKGSGGSGKFRGGDGVVREMRFLVPVQVTVLSDRRRMPPYGLAGGSPGEAGKNLVIRKDGTIERLPSKFETHLNEGDLISIQTPGGGGWGTP